VQHLGYFAHEGPMILLAHHPRISSCSLLLLHLLDHCYAPVSWPEPIEKEGVYTDDCLAASFCRFISHEVWAMGAKEDLVSKMGEH
jgi:hypothetical protein